MKELEDLISEVGSRGPFQRRMLILVLMPLFFLVPFPDLNDVFNLHVPDHWCREPGHLSGEGGKVGNYFISTIFKIKVLCEKLLYKI